MRKIRIIEHISLDGVIQAPGGPGEDGDYPYGGWAVPHHDPAVGEAIVAAHGEALDLLLGRRTYDIWSGHWPKAGKSPMADSLNAATKYVATHRPDSLGWGPVEDLGTDIVEGVRRIKAKAGPDLIVWGSSTLTPVLLEHGLADEVLLLVFPVLLGTGKRFFSDGAPPRELALVSTKAASSGVVISTYKAERAFAHRLLRQRGRVGRMADTKTIIGQAYSAFNKRDIDAALALMAPDVSWPRASEGGKIIGKEEIRAYWTRQWSEFDPHVEPLAITEDDGGKTRVRVHQLVKSLQGDVLSDSQVSHVFTMNGGLIAAMDLGDEADPAAGPSAAFAHRS